MTRALLNMAVALQEAYVKGVSAWNFDLAALKAEADRDPDSELPSIPEGQIPSQPPL